MLKASDFNKTVNNAKEEKFDTMVKIQENFIKENMKEGRKSVIWIFSDKEYYHNDLERTWFNEFENKARLLFEEQGFKINGILINW